MLNIQKMIASARECMGWPYVSPGTNDNRGIDCSGLFVKIFRDQGASIYHGSNTIYRKYCSEKGKLTRISQLTPGMAVFKWNPNTPEKFGDSLGDFQHIGLVASVNPLEIIHASTGTMCVTTDTKLGKWAYWGKLKDVDYGEVTSKGEDGIPVDTIGYITEDRVNFRTGPGAKKARIAYLNIGDIVEIIGETGSWLKCRANGQVGYIDSGVVSTEQVARQDTIQENPAAADKIVWIHAANGGRVNIRQGNGMEYSRITSVEPGCNLPYVATAENGWLAVKVKNLVGWVSPEFAVLGVG